MTQKRYRKLLRAEFTRVYMEKGLDRSWIARAYLITGGTKITRGHRGSYSENYAAITAALR